MLREEVFIAALMKFVASAVGRKLVRTVWSKTASQLPRAAPGCVDHRWSQKMGCLVALSGRNVAGIVAFFLDRDPTVLAWWHLPFEYGWKVRDKNGKAVGTRLHKPMFLVLRENGFFVLDFESDDVLHRRREAGQAYVQDPVDHTWRDLSAEEEYKEIDLGHELHSISEIPYILHQNLRDLDRYRDEACLPLTEELREKVLAVFSKVGFMPIREAVEVHEFDGDTIRRALVEGLIVADLMHSHLTDPKCLVFRDQTLLDTWSAAQSPPETLPLGGDGTVEVGEIIRWGSRHLTIMMIDGDEVFLQGSGAEMRITTVDVIRTLKGYEGDIRTDGSIEPRLRTELVHLSDEELALGKARLEFLEGKDSPTFERPSDRTVQRWRKLAHTATTRIRKIVVLGINNYKTREAYARFTENHEKFVRRIVKIVYDTSPNVTKIATYFAYKGRFPVISLGLVHPMCEQSFFARIEKHSDPVKKHGKRMAYKNAPLRGIQNLNNSPHGYLPHQVCHVDHTMVDIEIIHPDGTNLGRPWLTLFWDASVKRARAIFLSFRAPNTTSILMGLRMYVKEWGCLPKTVIVDGAPDLKTANVRELESSYDMELRHRKGSDPRSGSPIESENAARDQEVDKQLPGSTSHYHVARLYTGRISPAEEATLTLPDLYVKYEAYFFTLRSKIYVDPELGTTPEKYEDQLRRNNGSAEFIHVDLDINLIIMTAPLLRNATHKIQIQGVYANSNYFTNLAIRRAKTGASIAVREEPQCANLIYVRIDNKKWESARARDLRIFEGFTTYTASIARDELRRQGRSKSRASRRCPTAIEVRNAIRTSLNFDTRLAEKRQAEETKIIDYVGLNVYLDDDGNVRFGIRQKLGDVVRVENIATAESPGNLGVAMIEQNAHGHDPVGPLEGSVPRGESNMDDDSDATTALDEAPDSSTRAIDAQVATDRRRRRPRVLDDDALNQSGYL